jgi:hypothetical protein
LCYNTTTKEIQYQNLLTRTPVNTSTYTVLQTDILVGVTYTITGTVTITLPLASIFTNRPLHIVDEGGNAQNNNITIVTTGGDTIVGQSSALINLNYMALGLYSNGTNAWFFF